MASCPQRCLNPVAQSPARTRARYGNRGPSLGRSWSRFNASLPGWTRTGHASVLAEEAHRVVVPVDVFAFERGDVALPGAQVPAALAESPALGVLAGSLQEMDSVLRLTGWTDIFRPAYCQSDSALAGSRTKTKPDEENCPAIVAGNCPVHVRGGPPTEFLVTG